MSKNSKLVWAKYKEWSMLFGAIIAVGAIGALYWMFVWRAFPEDKMTRGEFGDMFGGLNAIFSGLAFLGVLGALWLQRKDLRDTQETMKQQQLALESQARASQQQVFETSFYNLLNNYQASADRLNPSRVRASFRSVNYEDMIRYSRENFTTLKREFFAEEKELAMLFFESSQRNTHDQDTRVLDAGMSIDTMKGQSASSMDEFLRYLKVAPERLTHMYQWENPIEMTDLRRKIARHQWSFLAPADRIEHLKNEYSKIEDECRIKNHFDFFTHILQYIEDSVLQEKAGFYVGLMEASLSQSEAEFLFYHAMSRNGSLWLMNAIDRHELLRTLPESTIGYFDMKDLWETRKQQFQEEKSS